MRYKEVLARVSRMRWPVLNALVIAGLVSIVGCDASFDDLRPRRDSAVSQGDGGLVGDGSETHDGPPVADGAGVDGDPLVDASPLVDAMPQAGPIASGPFMGFSGYSATGTATVERLANGTFQLSFSSNFSVSSAPGIVVVMSDRPSVGQINGAAGDVRILEIKSLTGAQTYTLSAAAASRAYVQLFCEPFGVDIGRAMLTPTPMP